MPILPDPTDTPSNGALTLMDMFRAKGREALFQRCFDRHKRDEKLLATDVPLTVDERLTWAVERLYANERPGFPLHVLPSPLRRYVKAGAQSIHCPPDLIAGPLLAVAGAAIGRAGRRLKVKDGWTVTSCLWVVGVTPSSGGKTPAMTQAENFYEDRQEWEYAQWAEKKKAHDADRENTPPPGPFPALKLTDTTIESLRSDLLAGPVLFSRDELGAWCHQMGQYKSGNADRFDWCSFWSHSAVNVGRRCERVYVREPFVSVTG